MKKSQDFYQKLKNSSRGGQAILALAPMAGVTDSAFRQICKKFGADIVYSEMASVNALVFNPQKTLEMLKFSRFERPYIVQLFGSDSKHFIQATKLIQKIIKPDGIDINFGCPVKKVAKQGAGAVLMNDLKLSKEIIKSVIDSTDLPVSIKLRSKVGKIDAIKFLDNIKDLDIKAIIIHGRILNQGHSGPVDCKIIKKARDYFDGVILANGGIKDYESAQELLNKTKADGIGIGQGALGRPWIFEEIKKGKLKIKSREDILKIALEHAKLVKKIKGEQGIIEMRKHLCWYVQGLSGARKIRAEAVKVKSIQDIEKIFNL